MAKTKRRAYNFPPDVRLRVFDRQDGVCAEYDKGLMAITFALGRTTFVNTSFPTNAPNTGSGTPGFFERPTTAS